MFEKRERDFLNDFLLFIITKDPVVVKRILNDMAGDSDCGNAPQIALEIVRLLRRKFVIKQLLNLHKDYLLSNLLESNNPKLIGLLRDLTNELTKNKACSIKRGQFGGKRSPKKRSSPKKRTSPKKRGSPKKRSCYRKKIRTVMGEFRDRKLRSSSGKLVKGRSQAIAIALNSAQRKCLL
jgi:hypothetical protein